MMLRRTIITAILLLLAIKATCLTKDFDSLNNSKVWLKAFDDTCTENWKTNWTLDGLIATVENTPKGMHFKAGPEIKNDAHHLYYRQKPLIKVVLKLNMNITY